MAVGDFDTFYPSDPWQMLTENQRKWYDPMLRDVYRKKRVFGQFTTFQQSLGAVNAKDMQITSLYDVHANTDPIGLRQMWLDSRHIDSRSLSITFNRYGGKVSYHAYDDIITYWKQGGSNATVIRSILNGKLGMHMTDVQDMLSRNALLSVPYKLYAGGATSFGDLSPDDRITTTMLKEIHLGMKYRDVPYAQSTDGTVGSIVCLTSPGVLFDLQTQTDPDAWLWPLAYADPVRLLNYEVGSYQNVRFIETPKCTLFNCGPITAQCAITTAINAGDGAPATNVDGVYKVGQTGVRNYVQLDPATSAGTMALFQLNQVATIHVDRTNANGVTNGVDYTDGKLHNRRIVAIDAGNKRLSFEEPIMEDFNVDLGSGVYGYVTIGQHVHTAIFVGGQDGIVNGVGRAPRLYTPPPVDDFESIYRFSWDSYQGYGVYNPKVVEVVVCGASFRQVGPIQTAG